MNINIPKILYCILAVISLNIYPAKTAYPVQIENNTQKAQDYRQKNIYNDQEAEETANFIFGELPLLNAKWPTIPKFPDCRLQPDKAEVFDISGYSNKKQIEDMLRNTYNIVVPTGKKDKNGNPELTSCSAFRLHKNWLLTAAHCIDMLYPNSQPKTGPLYITPNLTPGIQKVKGENDYAIIISAHSTKNPANGYAYIFNSKWPGQGSRNPVNTTWYDVDGSIKRGPWWAPKKPNKDIALIKINDKSAQEDLGFFNFLDVAKDLNKLPPNIQQSVRLQMMEKTARDRACFMNTPVTDYAILTIPKHEHSHALNVGPVLAFFFGDNKSPAAIFKNRYQDYSLDYGGARFAGDGILPGTSGSAIVQPTARDLMVVGVVSTAMPDKGLVASPFYDEAVRAFIKNTMGAASSSVKFVTPIVKEIKKEQKPIETEKLPAPLTNKSSIRRTF